MRNRILYILILALVALLQGCDTDIPRVGLGLDSTYRISRMQKLQLSPAITGSAYRWTVDGRQVSTQKDYIFVAAEPGVYHLTFEVVDAAETLTHDIEVLVFEEEVAYSPFISEVLEYCPAPGQFINTMPEYTPGDTYTDMLHKCTEAISGTNDGQISLGAFGGYITFRFDHTVMNIDGEKDFRIWGNAFYEGTIDGRKVGSAEPGIVMVSFDANCNGRPDDAWYELVGSEYNNPLTLHGYGITYTRPRAEDASGSDDAYISDAQYIAWTDSQGATGSISKNTFHQQSYWPLWVTDDKISFSGSCLPPNLSEATLAGGKKTLYCLDWGYVDNHPNDQADLNSFDINNAVDAFGNRVHLPGIDFVRVYTGINQYNGWLGETSTEISRAQDLHLPNY